MPVVRSLLILAALAAPALSPLSPAAAQQGFPSRATRAVYLDSAGVIRWKDDRSEVALFGANYVVTGASDFRAAGYLGLDRKRMIDEDMAHFARMGWDGLRLTFWGDWESSDHAGNLVDNEHLDLLDYLVARARERGIYMLLSPIQTYQSNWPDALGDTTPPGFGNHFRREELGTNPAAIAAQVRYLRQLLEHVNRYTGTKLKDEPAILFIEMINEPVHHPEDLAGSVTYIDALAEAVRSTGCDKLLFHNVSQEFAIAEAIRRSAVQGATFGWYPTGLVSGHELQGSYLRTVDAYDRMLNPALANRARIVYEFDSADLRTGYMYPAMVRAFRGGGAQFAAMFAYDMLGTASRNLGWQTHYLNLVYTPRKAMSAIIAAEAMRRLPRMRTYGPYPANTHFGDFHVSDSEDLSELVSSDSYLNAGRTSTPAPSPTMLRRVAGYGSSPVVDYEGEGVYFLDRVREGLWRLEVYPDAVPVRDPFEPPNAGKLVTRAIPRSWPMRIDLPDLGPSFNVFPLAGDAGGGSSRSLQTAMRGRVTIAPGIYLLSVRSSVDAATLPGFVGNVGMMEYHPPPLDSLGPVVEPLVPPTFRAGHPMQLRARVVTTRPPSEVTLSLRAVGWSGFRIVPMTRTGAYEYAASIPDSLPAGRWQYAITVRTGDTVTTFPGGLPDRPGAWNFQGDTLYAVSVVSATTPISLFAPATDLPRVAFTRIGDGGRTGVYRLLTSSRTGQPVIRLELPAPAGKPLDDYTASLVMKDRMVARNDDLTGARSVVIRARGLSRGQRLHLTLVERDGTAWSAAPALDTSWAEVRVPLARFALARAVTLPLGFPGRAGYWIEPASGRGGAGDRLRLAEVERLQLSLRPEREAPQARGVNGVEIEWVRLDF